tara:strand:- start:60 stop:317 length:258 start_codon:yes stop_codon:yes gene_type:complete
MDTNQNRYKRYVAQPSVTNRSVHNLEFMMQQMMQETTHNYTLIKSLMVRIQDLEAEVKFLKNEKAKGKVSRTREATSTKPPWLSF